jgi:hypothetical protein
VRASWSGSTGLASYSWKPAARARTAILLACVRGERNRRGAGCGSGSISHAPNELVAVDRGRVDIAHQHCVGALLEHFQGNVGIGRRRMLLGELASKCNQVYRGRRIDRDSNLEQRASPGH